jgi:hypothetical protein
MPSIDDPTPIVIWAYHGNPGQPRPGLPKDGPVLGYCSTIEKANEQARGKGWKKGPGKVTRQHGIRVGKLVYLLANHIPVDLDQQEQERDLKLRKDTLAHLSLEQRRVLGIK